MVWEALNKAVEKDDEILNMVMEIGSPFEVWSTLIKITAKTNNDEATYRVKKDFEALIIGSNEKVGEYFARVKVLRAET